MILNNLMVRWTSIYGEKIMIAVLVNRKCKKAFSGEKALLVKMFDFKKSKILKPTYSLLKLYLFVGIVIKKVI